LLQLSATPFGACAVDSHHVVIPARAPGGYCWQTALTLFPNNGEFLDEHLKSEKNVAVSSFNVKI